MRLQYELTQEDLIRVQAQLSAHRVARLNASPWTFVLATVAGGVIGWPILNQLASLDASLFTDGIPLGLYVVLVGLAGAIVWGLRRFIPPPKFSRLNAWSARRAARRAAKQSVFGEIILVLTEVGLVRTNSVDQLTVPFADIRDVLRTPDLVTLRLRKQHRVVVLPRRAFASEAEVDAFVHQLAIKTNSKVIDVAG